MVVGNYWVETNAAVRRVFATHFPLAPSFHSKYLSSFAPTRVSGAYAKIRNTSQVMREQKENGRVLHFG